MVARELRRIRLRRADGRRSHGELRKRCLRSTRLRRGGRTDRSPSPAHGRSQRARRLPVDRAGLGRGQRPRHGIGLLDARQLRNGDRAHHDQECHAARWRGDGAGSGDHPRHHRPRQRLPPNEGSRTGRRAWHRGRRSDRPPRCREDRNDRRLRRRVVRRVHTTARHRGVGRLSARPRADAQRSRHPRPWGHLPGDDLETLHERRHARDAGEGVRGPEERAGEGRDRPRHRTARRGVVPWGDEDDAASRSADGLLPRASAALSAPPRNAFGRADGRPGQGRRQGQPGALRRPSSSGSPGPSSEPSKKPDKGGGGKG